MLRTLLTMLECRVAEDMPVWQYKMYGKTRPIVPPDAMNEEMKTLVEQIFTQGIREIPFPNHLLPTEEKIFRHWFKFLRSPEVFDRFAMRNYSDLEFAIDQFAISWEAFKRILPKSGDRVNANFKWIYFIPPDAIDDS